MKFTIWRLLSITTVLGVLFALFQAEWGVWYRDFPIFVPFVSWSDLIRAEYWPVLFSLGCTIYTSGWLACWLVGRAYYAIAIRFR